MRIHHELLPLAERRGWETAIGGTPHSFFHTWSYSAAVALTTRLPTSLYVASWAGGRAVCPLLERVFAGHVDVATPPGFPGPVGSRSLPANFRSEWLRFGQSKGWVCGYIGLNPTLTDEALTRSRDAVHHNDVYVLDLAGGEARVASRLSQNRRRQLRRHDEHRLVFDHDQIEAFLVDELGAFYAERDAAPAYRLTEESVKLLCIADGVHLVGLELDGRVQAAAVFASTAWSADLILLVGTSAGRRLSFHLVWDAVRYYASLNVPHLNLGGGIRPGDGVGEFKRRFGGRRVSFWSLRQVYDRALYAALCRRFGVNADPRRAPYFPPYRRPPLDCTGTAIGPAEVAARSAHSDWDQ